MYCNCREKNVKSEKNDESETVRTAPDGRMDMKTETYEHIELEIIMIDTDVITQSGDNDNEMPYVPTNLNNP